MTKSMPFERHRLAADMVAKTAKISCDAAIERDHATYARQHGLPTKTNPHNWHGKTRMLSYAPAFRDTFAKLSARHKQQTRTYLIRFSEEGLRTSTRAEKVDKQRGWIPDIPKDVRHYRYERISAFLRFAYNLVGGDLLILYNIGKKSDHV